MRVAQLTISLLSIPALAVAQTAPPAPSGLAALELERSRSCVGTLQEVAAMDARLEPIVTRGRRLQALAQAIALEDRSGVEPFDASDSVEVRVRDWFQTDAALAQRYIAQQDAGVQAERAAGRETIKAAITSAINSVQTQANAILGENQELIQRAGPCDGAIFVRSAVLEACATASGPICEQAALPAGEAKDFRFVDAPESVWEVQEFRPWTTPGPLRVGPNGQLDGARTVGYSRIGNTVVSVAFSAMLRRKSEVTPAEVARFQAIDDSLGLTFAQDSVAFAPGLGLRAALPRPLASEARYVLHFGDPSAPDVVWSGQAGTGQPIEVTQPLSAAHVRRLRAGDAISLTAMGGPDGNEPEFTIEISNAGQPEVMIVLLNYMTSELSTDFARILQGARGS